MAIKHQKKKRKKFVLLNSRDIINFSHLLNKLISIHTIHTCVHMVNESTLIMTFFCVAIEIELARYCFCV